MVLVIAGLYHLRDELDCQYNANNTDDDTLHFTDQRRELSGSGCNGLHTIINYEESIYCRKRMSHILHICCNVSLDSEL